jgi:hypothetical protein
MAAYRFFTAEWGFRKCEPAGDLAGKDCGKRNASNGIFGKLLLRGPPAGEFTENADFAGTSQDHFW